MIVWRREESGAWYQHCMACDIWLDHNHLAGRKHKSRLAWAREQQEAERVAPPPPPPPPTPPPPRGTATSVVATTMLQPPPSGTATSGTATVTAPTQPPPSGTATSVVAADPLSTGAATNAVAADPSSSGAATNVVAADPSSSGAATNGDTDGVDEVPLLPDPRLAWALMTDLSNLELPYTLREELLDFLINKWQLMHFRGAPARAMRTSRSCIAMPRPPVPNPHFQ